MDACCVSGPDAIDSYNRLGSIRSLCSRSAAASSHKHGLGDGSLRLWPLEALDFVWSVLVSFEPLWEEAFTLAPKVGFGHHVSRLLIALAGTSGHCSTADVEHGGPPVRTYSHDSKTPHRRLKAIGAAASLLTADRGTNPFSTGMFATQYASLRNGLRRDIASLWRVSSGRTSCHFTPKVFFRKSSTHVAGKWGT